MFCPKCGKQLNDDARFCGACGTSINGDAPAKPAAPAAPAAPFSVKAVVDQLKQYKALFILAFAVLAFIIAIPHLTSNFDITATVSYGGRSQSASGPVADIIESGEYPLLLVGNLLFGLGNLAIAAIGVLLFLKEFKNLPLYDNYVAKFVKLSPLCVIGVVGTVTACAQILSYMFSGESETFFGQTISYSFAAHWTTWFFLFVYGGLIALDKLVLNKKAAPAVETPAAE